MIDGEKNEKKKTYKEKKIGITNILSNRELMIPQLEEDIKILSECLECDF
jgi:hypothetical protein